VRVFVTGTGRCGSVTCAKACGHISNYTAAHETHWGRCQVPEVVHPDRHIEVAPQLVLWIPWLRKLYPDSHWVHLIRGDQLGCCESLATRCRASMECFSIQWFGLRGDPDAAASCFYDAINDLCAALMPTDRTEILLEDPEPGWRQFWQAIGAEGNLEAALATWRTKHNARSPGERCDAR